MSGRERDYAFIFISHAVLEAESLLLAASLKRYLRCDYELIAAVPVHHELWGAPSELAGELFEDMGVRTAPIVNDLDPAYPTINRIFCLQIPTTADKVVVVDSDMLCMREFHDEQRFGIPFNSKPASLRTFTTEQGPWQAVYAATGVTMPEMRLPTTVSRQYIPPYFNTGLVAVDNAAGLGPAWLESCRQIMGDPSIPQVGRWADQIALAVAVERLELPYDCLDERYNFPLRLRSLSEHRLPYFCHYGNFQSAAREPAVVDAIEDLVAERPALAEALRAHEESSSLLAAHGSRSSTISKKRSRSRPELVVTGIEGSGIDLLTQALNGYSNCVVLPEPSEVLRQRAHQPAPWMIAPFYRQARADVAETAVESEDFVLGTSNAHPYLLRLTQIRKALPEARIVACVRDPFETIGSWKRSSEDLPGAGEALARAGSGYDTMPADTLPWLSVVQWEALGLIAGTADPAQRRATWWQFLAELILDQSGAVTIVDHRRLVENSKEVLGEVLSGYPAGTSASPITSPQTGAQDTGLDEADRQAIRAVCSQAGADLGIWR